MNNVSEKPFAFLRSSFMKEPIPHLPPLTNKKLEMALIQMGRPENIIASEKLVQKHTIL